MLKNLIVSFAYLFSETNPAETGPPSINVTPIVIPEKITFFESPD